MRKFFGAGLVALAVCGCTPSTEPDQESARSIEDKDRTLARALLTSPDGDDRGTVEFRQSDGALALQISLNGIEEGEKAFHLHTTGKCEAPEFKSAGGHLNPFGRAHGSLNEQGQHLGDFENIKISSSGSALATRNIEGDASEIAAILFDEDGTAVMIHAGPDDYLSDPAGAAGPRIACGVVERLP